MIIDFDSQLRFGAISNTHTTLVNSSFLADFVGSALPSGKILFTIVGI
jgi:hypothetical protein